MRTVYVNGDFLPENEAKISVFDRGFLFADAVYEVTSVVEGKLIDFAAHMKRLQRSMAQIDMSHTINEVKLLRIHRELVDKNGLTEGLIYLQITRGTADRDFDFSNIENGHATVLFTQEKTLIENPLAVRGQHIKIEDDLRWGRSDIKTVQLLYSSLMKTRSKKLGADDVWLQHEGNITEGSSSNAFIVNENAEIITRDLSNDILHGITRKAVLECASKLQMKFIERPFSITELKNATEAFSTSASLFVNPVVKCDDSFIGDGTPGKVAKALRELYIRKSLETAI